METSESEFTAVNLLQSNPEPVGCQIFNDRYFTSIPLADALLEIKCYITGTI